MSDNRTALDKRHRRSATTTRRVLSRGTSDGIDMVDAELIPVSPNELGLIQKQGSTPGQPQHDDPVGLRKGAWARPAGRSKYYIGKLSADALRLKDGRRHHTEVEFLKFAVDELRDGDGRPVPMFALYATEDDTASSDQAMQPVAIFTRRGIRFLAPVSFEAGTNAPAVGGRISRFFTDGGKFCINWQDDTGAPVGVVYDTKGSADESRWIAVGTMTMTAFRSISQQKRRPHATTRARPTPMRGPRIRPKPKP